MRKLGQPDWNPTADTLGRLEKLIQRGTTEVLVGTEAIINEARNGRMFILVDDEDRENEGDLVIPAQMATPDAINFMARHGRGLICLALTKERADQLGLEPMTRTNRSRNETAFTVSIEAREGITTGISAADRARTIAVAIDAANGPDAHRLARATSSRWSPGPAACWSAPAIPRRRSTSRASPASTRRGVICEIMREDGTMARLDDLMDFARAHGLKIGTIRDLIAYRLKKDHLVERVADQPVHRRQRRAVAGAGLPRQGERRGAARAGPRHARSRRSRCWSGCTASTCSPTCSARAGPRSGVLQGAMRMIEEEGSGVVVALHAAAPGSLSRSIDLRAGKPAEGGDAVRGYGIGAQILAALGVHDMILLSNTHHSPVGARPATASRSSKSGRSSWRH